MEPVLSRGAHEIAFLRYCTVCLELQVAPERAIRSINTAVGNSSGCLSVFRAVVDPGASAPPTHTHNGYVVYVCDSANAQFTPSPLTLTTLVTYLPRNYYGIQRTLFLEKVSKPIVYASTLERA